MLDSWSMKTITQLEKLASAFSYQYNYAVFDADGTLWRNDLSESLLALLEYEKIISVDRYDDAMLPMPISTGESLVSYYLRLCNADISLGYFWLCQAFAGFSLGELKVYIDDLFHEKGSISYMALQNDGSLTERQIERPVVFPWQLELMNFLREKGIHIHVVTASQEELVRMVVADPKYGFHIPPSNVIGMRLALRSSNSHRVSGQHEKNLDKNYYESTLTPSLSGITTWYSGKVAAIKEYIHSVRRPVLAVGNSESDLEMLSYTATDPGMKLLITENTDIERRLKEKIISIKDSDDQKENHFFKTQGWKFILPDQFQ